MDETKLEKGNYNLSHDQDGNIVLRSTGLDVLIDKDGDYAVRLADKASPLAEGHNPSKLTEEQVGVADGWRLLAADEISDTLAVDKSSVKYFDTIDLNWQNPFQDSSAFCRSSTYRTKQPAGHFRPAPQRRVFNFTAKQIDSVLIDLRLIERAISFGHPHEVVEQTIRRFENLKQDAS